MRINNILDSSPKDSFYYFLQRCNKLKGVDLQHISDVAITTIRYLNADNKTRQKLRQHQVLEQRWYSSLLAGSPDWEVYNTDYYLGELWACWIVYSRRYLLSLRSSRAIYNHSVFEDIGEVNSIVDLGCGFGYTTAAFTEIFPKATITGTNRIGTLQYNLAIETGKQYGFTVLPDINLIKRRIDIIFASEYFEHILNPIDHLLDILQKLKPRVLLIANTFSQKSVGHFDYYKVNGSLLDGKTTSRLFNSELRNAGYIQIKTKLWNNRPAYWRAE